MSTKDLKLSVRVIEKIIDGYTRESGVRGLEKNIAKIVRYCAKNIATEIEYNPNISEENIVEILGPAKLIRGKYESNEVARKSGKSLISPTLKSIFLKLFNWFFQPRDRETHLDDGDTIYDSVKRSSQLSYIP